MALVILGASFEFSAVSGCLKQVILTVSSFTMAEQMGADSELLGQIIVFTSTLAVFTIFVWIYIVKTLRYI